MQLGNFDFNRTRALAHRLDSPKLPLLITFVMYFVLIFVVVRDHGYDFSYFVVAGDRYCDQETVPKSLTVLTNSRGYDGQFYYRLALHPFTSKVTDFGITLDNPAYRNQRVIYPLVVWALSFGRSDFVPILLVVVNFVCVCALGWLGGLFARSMRLHSLWGLAFPFYPGFLLALSRDVADVLSATLLLASLICLRRQKHLPAALLFILAILTRETVLVVAVGAAYIWLNEIWNQKSSNELRWYFSLSSFLAYSVWQLILLYNWGPRLWDNAHRGGHGEVGWPFVAFSKFFLSDAALQTQMQKVQFVERLLIVLFAVAVVWSMRSSVAFRVEKTSWLLYLALACLLTEAWVEDWSYLRVLSEFYVLGAIILLGSASKMKVPVFVCWGAVWLSYFLRFTDIVPRSLHRLTHL